ncbi:MAG: protein-glutamate O-methyltransferase CheR [Bryobacter sp.]|nr:protein-glutamate O-methyltransferase CheR [Bryobacter sp.]
MESLPLAKQASLPAGAAIDTEAVGEVLRQLTGISLRAGKKELVESRLRRKLRELGLSDVKDYLKRVEANSRERQAFINLLTTNESRFFRTERVWQYLERTFLPAWAEQHVGKRLQIWSGAASSGQEAYSLAMLCQEFGAKWAISNPRQKPFEYRIWASDIDTEILTTAQEGWYEAAQWESLRRDRPFWFDRYAKAQRGGYAVAETLKIRVEFSQHNLLRAWAASAQFDLVMLRNVLIYFEEAEQLTVLRHVVDTLRPGGTLVLGESESLGQLEAGMAKENLAVQYVAPQIYARPVEGRSSVGRATSQAQGRK